MRKDKGQRLKAKIAGVLLLLGAVLGCSGQELNPGYTFADGQLLTASQLRLLVQNATVLPAFYTDKGNTTAMHASDLFCIYSLGNLVFQQVPFSTIITSPLLISSQASTNAVSASSSLLLLDNGALFQFNPAALLTNALAVPGLLTNWSPVVTLSNSDSFPIWSVASNRTATATWSNALANVWTNLSFSAGVGVLSNSDSFPIWSASSNRNASATVSNLVALVQTNSDGLYAPKRQVFSMGLNFAAMLDKAHGLSSAPAVRLVLVVTNLANNAGFYKLGDEIPAEEFVNGGNQVAFIYGANATNVWAGGNYGSGGSLDLLFPLKTGGGSYGIFGANHTNFYAKLYVAPP